MYEFFQVAKRIRNGSPQIVKKNIEYFKKRQVSEEGWDISCEIVCADYKYSEFGQKGKLCWDFSNQLIIVKTDADKVGATKYIDRNLAANTIVVQ